MSCAVLINHYVFTYKYRQEKEVGRDTNERRSNVDQPVGSHREESKKEEKKE